MKLNKKKTITKGRATFLCGLMPSPRPSPCTVRGHSEHLFGDMVDTYN